MYESIEELCQQCGYCYYNCPIVSFDLEKAERDEFGSVAEDEIGHIIGAYMAQATDEDILRNAQRGGVATALLKYMLERGNDQCCRWSGNNGSSGLEAEANSYNEA